MLVSLLSLISIQVLITFMTKDSDWFRFLIAQKNLQPVSKKAFLLFKESLQLRGGSSFGKRKTHSSSFLLGTDNTLLNLQPPPPPQKNPQKESGEMCHIPHDAHSYGNEDSRCRFFFLHQSRAEVVRGCITCQHLHPVEASWQWSLLKLMLTLTLPLKTFFSMLQGFQSNFYLLSLLRFPKQTYTISSKASHLQHVSKLLLFKTAKSVCVAVCCSSSTPVCFSVSENVLVSSFDLSLALLPSINLSKWQNIKTDDCNPHEQEEKTATRFLAQCSKRSTPRRHDLTAVGGDCVTPARSSHSPLCVVWRDYCRRNVGDDWADLWPKACLMLSSK